MPESSGSWLITDTFRTTSAADGTLGAGGERRVSVLRVFGDIDLNTHAAFEAGLDRVLRDDPERIVLDATAMTFCGARGLAALMSTVALGADHGVDVAVVGFSPLLHRLCVQLWPGPQPSPYPSLAEAVAGAAHRDVALDTTVSSAVSA